MRTVKMMIDGVWRGDVPDTPELARQRAQGRGAFRATVSADGASGYAAEGGRYHLYVSYACPWAHRTILYRSLKGLEGIIGMSVLHPRWGTPDGWAFADTDASTVDHAAGRRFLHEVYGAAAPPYTGKVTVPVLWDGKTQTIVNNESAEIIRILNTAFDGVGGDAAVDFYPADLRAAIEALNAWLLPDVCEGVYAAGFAVTQAAHESAIVRLFAGLGRLEALLSDGRAFLLGARPTESDWHLFCTAVRFDAAYHGALRCNLRRYADYPHLSAHLRRIYGRPCVAATVRLDHVKRHYYDRNGELNPEIVPLGPPVALGATPGRAVASDLEGSQPDAWRYVAEVQDAGQPADVTGYR